MPPLTRIIIRNNQRRKSLENIVEQLNKLNQTNKVLNARKRAMELLKKLEPIRNNNNRSLHPATRKLVNTVTNYNRVNAQQRAAQKLANSYMRNGKMYPFRRGNMEALIRHYFSSDINFNRAKKHMNMYLTKPSLLTTRVGRVRSFINQLKKQHLRGPSPR